MYRVANGMTVEQESQWHGVKAFPYQSNLHGTVSKLSEFICVLLFSMEAPELQVFSLGSRHKAGANSVEFVVASLK